jgi:ubiquinone/menaquinone biosynthesis C-methylase UbiE
VNIIRYRGNGSHSQWKTLTEQDHSTLDVILRNEADMAYRRRARILIDYLELQDSESILDCGCGMGFYLMALGKLRNLKLVGLDGDLERLQWAQRERVPATLLKGNIFDLPIADEFFDKVLFSEVLEHLSDDRRGLYEIYRILKPGGILALSVPHANYPFWWDPLNAVWTRVGGQPIRTGPIAGIWSNHERLYEPNELIRKMQETGFELECVEEQTHFSFPFIHFIVYGIGKPLLEKNLLPSSLRASADRFRGAQNRGSMLNPINMGVNLLRYFDRRNETPAVEDQSTFVNILVKARKPLR